MTEDDPTDEISDIEARIEALAEISERCRKYILASKIAIGSGAALLLIAILGLLGMGQSKPCARVDRSDARVGSSRSAARTSQHVAPDR